MAMYKQYLTVLGFSLFLFGLPIGDSVVNNHVLLIGPSWPDLYRLPSHFLSSPTPKLLVVVDDCYSCKG